MRNPLHPLPAPPAFGGNTVIPETSASLLSKLLFRWLDPFLAVGFSRPLQKDDLWQLPPEHQTSALSKRLDTNFYARCPPDKRPAFIQGSTLSRATNDNVNPRSEKEEYDIEESPRISSDSEKGNVKVADESRDGDPANIDNSNTNKVKTKDEMEKYDSSLLKALNHTFFWRWWSAGVLKLFADTLNTTTPLITKLLLTYLTESYLLYHLSPAERASLSPAEADALGLNDVKGLGYGIGLAFALFVMQEASSLMTNHYMLRGMTTGLLMRTSTIGTIFRKSLRISARARSQHSVGKITTMISSDATRLDHVGAFAHEIWIAPIQLVIGIGLLIHTLGYSALVGLGVLILGLPLQVVLVLIMFRQRKKGVKITDQRVRLTGEVLQGIRLIKFYAWEAFYGLQIAKMRTAEVKTIRTMSMATALLVALVTFIPVLASVLSFITYALSGHDLNVAIIFTSLQFFNIIRAPMLTLPLVLGAGADAAVALQRISKFLMSEELEEPYNVEEDEGEKNAVRVDGDFTWEVAGKVAESGGGKFEIGGRSGGGKEDEMKKKRKKGKVERDSVLPTVAPNAVKDTDVEAAKEEKPFELKDVKLNIPKGSFVAVVGQIGSGKSSLLQAMIGEMRKTKGDVTFGGSVAYVPQTAWIMNATLRQNILFGHAEEEERFREIIRVCCLEHDLEMLPHGEETEIGEKGINLSGGQKARVSLARAAYSQSDIVLLDDSLSAVDAWVGKSILDNCILNGPLAESTRILVTHALHVLDKTNYIYVMDNGVICEQGTFNDLMQESVMFKRLMAEYGSLDREGSQQNPVDTGREKNVYVKSPEQLLDNKGQAALMQAEERITGAVSWDTYKKYSKFGGGVFWVPFLIIILCLSQGASVANNLFLGFWTAESISGFSQAAYMGVYAALGVAQAVLSFFAFFSFTLMCLSAGLSMFKGALMGVLRSPVSFFDTTPMGRIISRLSKDQDTVDTELSMTLYQFTSTAMNVLGTVALVFYTFPFLGIIFAPLSVLYYAASVYYRRSSVETKRLDSLMRSALYASYTETLTGLSTVRAYRAQDHFVTNAEHGLDMENRAYYMTVTIQRWLGVRLDFFGNILILGIALFAAGFRRTVDPSKIGVVLTYSLSITQTLSSMVSTFAQNEQNMNAVERILVYTELPSEADARTPNDPPLSWPEKGEIRFKNVGLAYRPELPPVLKDVSFDVKPGEKVGIVGRTGAGKSSLLQALFRIVELQNGTIEIDGHNIREVGLGVLRSRLALVPQDNTLFLGTLRENLDPDGSRTDAELISSLQRAWLLPKDGTSDPAVESKFSLDAPVSDEGGNFSVGEKQLLALCRALVKNSRIIVLDEATSSVDVETDAKVQKTVQTEFKTHTLLCIAHRLNTIAYYDRVIVMDSGRIAEYDTPLNLFDIEDSIFRSLCNEARLSRQDIVRIRAGVSSVVDPVNTL